MPLFYGGTDTLRVLKSSRREQEEKGFAPHRGSTMERSKLWPCQHASSCSRPYQCHAPFTEIILLTFLTSIFAFAAPHTQHTHSMLDARNECVAEKMENYLKNGGKSTDTISSVSQWRADNKMETNGSCLAAFGASFIDQTGKWMWNCECDEVASIHTHFAANDMWNDLQICNDIFHNDNDRRFVPPGAWTRARASALSSRQLQWN